MGTSAHEPNGALISCDDLLESFSELAWVKNLSGQYLHVNQAFLDFHHLVRDQVIGHHAAQIFLSDTAASMEHGDRQTLLQGSYYQEVQFVDRQGQLRWVETSKRLVRNRMGQVIGLFGTTRDTTERHEAQSARMAIERALLETQRHESLSMLAGGIAHDFNNILAGILGHADLALLEIDSEQAVREHLSQIMAGTQIAARLVSLLLAYAGRGKQYEEVINLNTLIRNVVDLARPTWPHTTQVIYQLVDALPGIKGDGSQLQQVVLNLITNAADALQQRAGTITITTQIQLLDHPPTEIRESLLATPFEGGRYVLLTVADTGVGMDETTLQRIFEPFFSTKRAGRGLGLAAVQGIVRSHHGFLCVQSRLGQGTQFQIWLPTEPVTASAHPRISLYPHNTGHVLVVDDDATIRDVAGKMIERMGFHAVFADDGERALELIKSTEQPWTVMLIDITMPGMNGIDVVMQLQASHPQLPIVLMSGYRAKEIPDTLPAHVVFLPKPFSYVALRDTIARVLAYTRGIFSASASPDTP
ncbi:MAG: hypothetical protein Fur005_40670 [Roseiflexaceae bacterium]